MKILIPLLLLTLGVKGNGIIDDLLTSREWTSADGKPLKAELISADDKILELKRSSDRRVFKIPLNKISEDDQKLVADAKKQLIKSANLFDTAYTEQSTAGISGERRAKLYLKNAQLRKRLIKPEYWELARRLGILEQINDSLPKKGYNSLRYLQVLSLPIDSIALASGAGKLGKTGSSKSFLLKSGNIFFRLNGKDYRQRGQKIVRMNGERVDIIATVGSSLQFSFPAVETSTKIFFTHFSVETIGITEAVVVNIAIKEK